MIDTRAVDRITAVSHTGIAERPAVERDRVSEVIRQQVAHQIELHGVQTFQTVGTTGEVITGRSIFAG